MEKCANKLDNSMKNLLESVKELAQLLQKHNQKLTTAESCTGGQLASVLTSIPGSSAWFERGFVTYSNESKQEMLGVSNKIIAEQGAVSEQTAMAMTQGALEHSHAEWSVAITGIAGPDGGTAEKPVGTVWIAWQQINQPPMAKHYQFSGGRIAVRTQVVEESLVVLMELLRGEL